MDVRFFSSFAHGCVDAPPSKSMAHRLLICASLANGRSVIKNIAYSNDILATLDCLSALGAKCTKGDDFVTIDGIDVNSFSPVGALNCRESGSTLRFMIPIALMSQKECEFRGAEYLMHRPQSVYEELFKSQGIKFEKGNDFIRACGCVKPGHIKIAGNVSSQFISGLLFTLPNLQSESTIEILPPVESRSYINLTVKSLERFGVKAEWADENTLYIKGNQRFIPSCVTVEGDYSNACAYDAFNTVGGDVNVSGLAPDSLQGDRIYKDYFKKLAESKAELDISDCPDLGPVLFAVAAVNHGGVFTGAERLRLKESDRIAAMKSELEKVGGTVTENGSTVTVEKADLTSPETETDSHNDHRIVMAMSIILSRTGGVIRNAQAINKSLPDYFDVLKKLSVKFEIL